VGSPKSLLEAMSGDDDVFTGIAPDNSSWYLRFYLYWDDDGFNLLGRFDVTLSQTLVDHCKEGVGRLGVEMVSQDSEAYYRSIIL
jgi:hypothetical protein